LEISQENMTRMQTECFRANDFYHAGARFITALLIVLWPFTPIAPRAVTSQITTPKCDATEKPGVCTVDANREVRLLATGSVSEREIKAGEEHFYRVALSAGEFTQIVVEQQGIDLGVAACAQLQVVSEVDRQSGSWGPEAISLIAKESGEYLIRVKPLLSTGKGSYKIQVKQQRRSEPLDQVRINAERIVTEGGRFYARGGAPCLRQSIASYEQALSLWQSLGEKEEMAITLYGLGWSYSDLGSQGMVKFPSPRHRLRWNYEAREDHLAALRYFNQALEIMRSLNDPYGEAITLAGRALILSGMFAATLSRPSAWGGPTCSLRRTKKRWSRSLERLIYDVRRRTEEEKRLRSQRSAGYTAGSVVMKMH
jgi:tetratricopeptide (TPR) repeat protein